MKIRRIPFALILFAINAYVCWRVFRLDYSHRMDSIEGAYVGIARHILSSWHDLSWWPAWYGGVPFRNSYPPLLHMLSAFAAWVMQVSPARGHHVAGALLYCLGPVFAYLMLARLSGKRLISFCAALLYTVFSPCGYLVPAVGLDMGHPLRPRRLGTLVAYGDGPHVAGLALLPLAIFLLDRALHKRTPLAYALAVLGFIAVVYTNWLGAFALAAMVLCYLAALQPWREWLATAALGIAAYAVAMPWVPPSLIQTIQLNAKVVGGDFSRTNVALSHAAPFAIAIFLALRWLMGRLHVPGYLQFLVLFSGVMTWIGLGYSWFRVAVVPQPDRYHLEVDFGLMLALGVGVGLLLLRAPRRVQQCAFAALLLFSVWQIRRAHYYAKGLISPVDITTTIEYKTAKFLDREMHGARVMVPGSIEFWLQAFTDTPQIGGGFENGEINYVDKVARFVIYSGMGDPDSHAAVLWLKAYGIQAMEAGGPNTREHYHTFVKGERFGRALEEIWRDGDDAVYRVPLRNASLAHVMRTAHLVKRQPYNGVDVAELKVYVDAIDDPGLPEAQFVWRRQGAAEIFAPKMLPNQIISVQMTFDTGWHARVAGRDVKITKDGLGFLAVEPACSGECRIELVYDGGRETAFANWARGLTILCWMIWAVWTKFWRRGFRAERLSVS